MSHSSIQRVVLLANYLNDRQESMQRFAQVLADELPKRHVAVEVIRPEARFGKLRASGHGLGKWLGYIDKFILFPNALRRRVEKFQPGEILHIADHSNAVYTRTAAAVPHLVTCHDVLAIRSARGEFPRNKTGASGRIYQRLILEGLNRARRVTCVSQQTRDDLLRIGEVFPENVGVTYNGLNYPYRPMPPAEARRRMAELFRGRRVPASFVLHVGGNQWYKNRPGVIRIYEELAKRMNDGPDLILAGKPWPESLRAQIDQTGLRERVHEITDCSNEDLRALYSLTEAFLFPSLMEGFGWPIIEAQACGARVVTSHAPPMSEIAGPAAVCIHPCNPELAAADLRDLLLESEDARAERSRQSLDNAARFSTAGMIDGYLNEYEAALKQQNQ